MKFIDAWDSLEKENRNLKKILSLVTIIACFLSMALMSASSKEPLIFERGCDTRAVFPQKNEVSRDELKDFLKEAISARFNSGTQHLLYLSYKQQGLRDQEQKELESRSMKQTVVVQDVQFEKDKVTVVADRLISVGEIRSAFKFPLDVKIETQSRSLFNPYGLVLAEVEQVKEKTDKK